MIRTIYIAGPYARRDEAEALADELWSNGCFVVTSRWHGGPAAVDRARTIFSDRKIAMQNWHDIEAADLMVAFVDDTCRGTLVEIGAAIGHPDMYLVLIGKRGDGPTLMIEHDCAHWTSRENAVNQIASLRAYEEAQAGK